MEQVETTKKLGTALNKRLRNEHIETKARALIDNKRDPFTQDYFTYRVGTLGK